MGYGVINSDLITTSDGVSSAGLYGFKNKLINGDARIDQRNAGASVTPTANGTYTVDRWAAWLSQSSKFSVQRNAASVTPPVGFSNYLGITSLAATSVGASDYFFVQQPIEGFNFSDLAWGTASAATVTISFWVRSSLTGSFGAFIRNGAANRSYPFTYTVSSANTWELKSVTIAGDTTGTWGTDNTAAALVGFSLGAGSSFSGTAGTWAGANYVQPTGATSVVGTNGATFYITGVQLEKGSTATSFDYRDYGRELAMCQRYYTKSYDITVAPQTNSTAGGLVDIAIGNVANANYFGSVNFLVSMRSTPTVTVYSFTSSTASRVSDGNGTDLAANSGFANLIGTRSFTVQNQSGSTITAANGGFVFHYVATSEL